MWLREVFVGGEVLSVELGDRFFKRLKANLHNLYGPTEATIDSTWWTCSRENDGTHRTDRSAPSPTRSAMSSTPTWSRFQWA